MPSVHSTPFQAEDYNPESYEQRMFPNVSVTGRTYGTTTRTHLERGDLVKVPNLDRQAHHHQHLFRLKHNKQVGTFAVDPGSIRGCLFRYTYVWLNNKASNIGIIQHL